MPIDEQYPAVAETELQDTPDNSANADAVVPQENADSQAVQTAAGAVQQPVWDGTQWAYQYKGKQIVPKSREHLMALAQKGHGFNEEYDRLKQERSQFEPIKQQYDKYAKLDQLFQQHPDLQQKINNVVTEYRAGTVKPNSEQNPAIDPSILAEQQRLFEQTKGMYEQLTQAQADKQLENEVNSLKTKYQGDWDTDDGEGTLEKKVLNHALKGNFPTLESAYKDLMWDSVQTNAKAEALKQSQAQRQADFKAGKVGVGVNAGAQGKPGYSPKMSYNAIADAVAKGELV